MRPINVLHVNTTDIAGGAARAAYRLHEGLLRLGHESALMVGRKTELDDRVHEIAPRGSLWWILDKTVDRVLGFWGLQYLFVPSVYALLRDPLWSRADVIHLHNLHGGYFGYVGLPALSRKKPVVWTLHDMWAFTGHCAYDMGCGRWRTGCGKCPDLMIDPPLRRDMTAVLWSIKRRVYQHCAFVLVTPSRWLADLVRESPLLGQFEVRCIPNGVDTEIYAPLDRRLAREALKLPQDRQIVMFSAYTLSEKRKGGDLLEKAFGRLALEREDRLGLLMLGGGSAKWQERIQSPVYALGPVRNERMMALCYAAADVFVLPTLADNLPNVLLESMACGVPVVSFAVGGVSEAVRHMETGYLAQPMDWEELARGIALVLDSTEIAKQFASRGREIALAEYSLGVQARRYEALYREMLDR